MKFSRLLYLTPGLLTVWQRQDGHWQQECSFAASAPEEFSAWLLARKQERLHLLVDLPGEKYYQEPMPSLGRQDRRDLMARKLARHFPPGVPTLSHSIRPPGESDEQLLLGGIDEATELAPWLERLEQAGTCLSGMHTPALLTPAVLARLGHTLEIRLVISCHADHLRSSAVSGPHCLLTRRLPLFPPEDADKAIGAESARLRQQLIAQDFLTPEQELPVTVIGPIGLHERFTTRAPIASHLSYTFIPLSGKTDDTSAESIFFEALAETPPPQQFASRQQLRHERRARHGRYMLVTAIALFGMAIPTAAWLHHQANLHDQESQQLHEQRTSLELAKRKLLDSLPGNTPEVENRLRIARRHAELLTQRALPRDCYQAISNALSKLPEIELTALNWRHENHLEIVDIEGRLASASNRFDELIATLRTARGSTIEVRQPPEVSGSLTGNSSPATGRPFVLRLVRQAGS
jgi:hypothetical protein